MKTIQFLLIACFLPFSFAVASPSYLCNVDALTDGCNGQGNGHQVRIEFSHPLFGSPKLTIDDFGPATFRISDFTSGASVIASMGCDKGGPFVMATNASGFGLGGSYYALDQSIMTGQASGIGYRRYNGSGVVDNTVDIIRLNCERTDK